MYVCALRPRGEPLSKPDVLTYLTQLGRAPGGALHSLVEGPFAAVATSHSAQLRPQLARWRCLVGAGDVRLDNRARVAELAGTRPTAAMSDLELVLAALDAAGEGCVPAILGDFAFVAWDARAQKLLAVRDAFGVKPLYRCATDGMVLFSSDIAPLNVEGAYDLDFIADYLTGHAAPATQTIWRGISAVGAGSLVRYRGTVQSRERYWQPDWFEPANDGDETANAIHFRELFDEGVRARMEGAGDVWAHLSGGLDSSAVVSVASGLTLPGARLAGTVTVVDTLGEGDERVYSDAVLERCGVRNEQVQDYWAWQDDGRGPPLVDQPYPMLPFHARDQAVHDTVRKSGARVLLSGMGADHYLDGTLDYITDMASAWRVRDALRELTTWSVATRQSFWQMGRRYLLEPFVATAGATGLNAPPWMSASLVARLEGFPQPPSRLRGAHTSRFAGRVTAGLQALPAWLERWPYGEHVEMRYPFLYRPLVEWSLRLPPRQRVRPHARKWILREATRDVLPETVRTRSTKGGIDARILWSLRRERPRLERLLRDPILAQLGCVDGALLRDTVDRAARGVPVNNVHLFSALSLETWLASRAASSRVASELAVTAA